MNSFDFSLYDPEDETKVEVSKKPIEKTSKKESSFDFEKYDLNDLYTEGKPFDQMNALERYKVGSPFKGTKSLLSSATAGFSELVPGLGLSDEEKATLSNSDMVSDFVGMTLPVGAASKGVGLAAKAGKQVASKLGYTSPDKVSKGIKYLSELGHVSGTGALYGAAKETSGSLGGDEFDFTNIPKTAAEFVLFHTALRGIFGAGSKIYSKFTELPPETQAKILQEKIIPKDLPKSQRENSEEILKIIKDREAANISTQKAAQQETNASPTFRGAIQNQPETNLSSRRITQGEDIGLRPTPQGENVNIKDRVGNIFSENRFYNTTQGGQAIKNEIMEVDRDVYKGVNDLYRNSRELNAEVTGEHPRLANELQTSIDNLSRIPEPSDVQRRLIRTQQRILDRLVQYENILDDEGRVIGRDVVGYNPIDNQTLIDQVQALRQIIDFDFAHGNTKNIFRPTIDNLQNAVVEAAENSGSSEAAQAFSDARSAYRVWSETFDNDYIRPFRDSSNQDFSKLLKSSLDLDESNMLRKVLNLSERGQELANASTREIVEKNLSKYFDNTREVDLRDFNTSLRELEAVITPEQAEEIRTLFNEQNRKPSFKAKVQTSQKPQKSTNDEKIIAKFAKKKPEDIQRMMNNRSGIKELREHLSDTKEHKELFDRYAKQKMRSILREGKIEKDFTGNDLYEVLNKEKNYDLFSEIIGESETETLRLEAKEIGKKQVAKEKRNASIRRSIKKIAGYKGIELILSIL